MLGAVRLAACVAALVLTSCLMSLTPVAAADSLLVPSAGDLGGAGLHPIAASTRTVSTALEAGLPRSLKQAVARGLAGVVAGARGDEHLDAAAFVLGSQTIAHRVLTAWRQAHHGSAVRLGHDGTVLTTRIGRGQRFTLAWREGARVGVLYVSFTGPGATVQQAEELAPIADARLRAVLPRTAYDRVLAGIRPNGTVSQQTALQAFALTYGSLPGVHPPAGTPAYVPSGTLAAGWVLADLPRLSPTLRAAVLSRLGLATGRKAHGATFGDPDFHQSTALTAEASLWAARESAQLPGQPKLGLTIVAGDSVNTAVTKDGDHAEADALPVNAAGMLSRSGPYCRIRVNVSKVDSSTELALTLAHEVFHCFEFSLTPTVWDKVGAWVREGLAEWVAEDVVKPPYAQAGGFLETYIGLPDQPVLQRGYSAIGFWGHVQDADGDLWSKIPKILTTVSSPAAFAIAGGDGAGFLSTWASSIVRPGNSGPEWEMFSPVRPPDATALPTPRIEDTVENLPVQVPAFSTRNVVIEPQDGEPLVEVSVQGTGRLSDQHNYTDLSHSYYCMQATCECPPGSTGTVPDNQPLEPGADLALSAGSSATDAEVEFHDLDEYCNPKGVTLTEFHAASCVGCSAPTNQLADLTDGAVCTLDSAGQLTIALSGSGTLKITAPAYRSLPKRSDGATVIELQAPRGAGPDMTYGGWSTGDFLGDGSGAPPTPFGSVIVHRGGKDGSIAASLFNPGVSNASLLAAGAFRCKRAIG
jgi:hypothetical protein